MISATKASELVQVKNILFPTDFTEPSERALPYAAALAREYGATVYAFHMLGMGPLAYGAPDLAAAAIQSEMESASESMRRIDSQLAGLKHYTIVERALSVGEAVDQAIRGHGIDLVVLGTHGRTGAGRFLLGSVAEEIFRRSRVPVLTVGPAVRTSLHNDGRFRQILFATDYTAAAASAGPYGLRLAERDGAQFMLLHIASCSEPPMSLREMIPQLYKMLSCQNELAVPAGVALEYGEPGPKIVEAAKTHSADLVVLGVHGARGHMWAATHWERHTAHEVVVQAPCAVLTVSEENCTLSHSASAN